MEMFQRLDEEKKKAIINAAMEEFSSKGYKAASTIEITRNAGISKGSLFHYFGSKEQLYKYLIDFGISLVEEGVYAMESEGDFFQYLMDSTEIKLRTQLDYPHIKDFYVRCYLEDSPMTTAFQEKYSSASQKFMVESIKRWETSPVRQDFSAQEALRICFWIMEGASNEYLKTGDLSTEAMTTFAHNLIQQMKKLFQIPKEEKDVDSGN